MHTIAGDGREVVGELRLNDHPVALKLAQRQRNHLSRGLVQIQRLLGEFLPAEQRTQPSDHIRGAIAVAYGPPRGLARTVDVGRSGIQHSQACSGVGDDARERLVDFVRDRRGQRSERRHPCDMCELGARPFECLLGKSSRRHILYRSGVLHPPVLIPAAVRDSAEVLHRGIRQAQPNLVVDVSARPSGELHFL